MNTTWSLANLVLGLAAVLALCTSPDDDVMTLAEAQVELEAKADPGWPVELVRADIGDDWGHSDWDEDRETFVVTIHEDASDELALWILEHEWGHLLVWDAATEDDHGPLFGVAWARCYRALH